MSFVRSLESFNRRVWYSLLRLGFRNRDVAAPIDATAVGSILIIRHDRIGDMIVTTASFELLARRMPQVAIDVIASPQNAGVIAHDQRIRSVHVFNGGVWDFIRLARRLRRNTYDVVFAFVLSKTTESGLLANVIGGRHAIKVAVRNDDRAHLYSTFFNVQIRAPRFTRSMARILAGVVADTFGWKHDAAAIRPSLHLTSRHRESARRFHDSLPRLSFVVLNISSGSEYRRWPFERNEGFIRAILTAHPELRIVVVSSPDDHEEACRLASIDGARVAVAPSTADILDVAAIIEGATIVVSPDTSIIHIASAMGAPALTMYSRMASHYTEWMPTGVPFEAVVTSGQVPIDTLTVDEVVEAFEKLLGRIAGG